MIADVLLEIVLAVGRSVRGRPSSLPDLVTFRDMLRPVPGLELVSARGEIFTGILIIQDNEPLLMLAARRSPPSRLASSRGYPGPWPTGGDDFSGY